MGIVRKANNGTRRGLFSNKIANLIAPAVGAAVAAIAMSAGVAAAKPAAAVCTNSITDCGCTIKKAGTYNVTTNIDYTEGLTASGDCIDIAVSGVVLNLNGNSINGPYANGGSDVWNNLINDGIRVLSSGSGDVIIGGLDQINSENYNLQTGIADINGWNNGIESDSSNVVAGHFVSEYNYNDGVLVSKTTGNTITGFGSIYNYNYGVQLLSSTGSKVTSSLDLYNFIGIYLGYNSGEGLGNPAPKNVGPSNNNFVNDNILFSNYAGIVVDINNLGNQVLDNASLSNEYEDLYDFNPKCATNVWELNIFTNAYPSCID